MGLGRAHRILVTAIAALMIAGIVEVSVKHPTSSALKHVRRPVSHGSVDVGKLPDASKPTTPPAHHYRILPEIEKQPPVGPPRLPLGGAKAPGSPVTPATAAGFNAINILEMEKAGTGQYAGTSGGLEPPDQALCVGNGYVMEGINLAWKIYTTKGAQVTPAIPITQFFNIAPGAQAVPPSSFVSDPRCVYDSQTHRFYALTLEADEASGLTEIPFTRAHTYFAVSKTSNPAGEWWVYSIDITDDGLYKTPRHPTCPCIDDQPLMGFDKYGLYITANEFSDSEIFPVAPPPQVNQVFGTLPDYRNGQAQVYAMSKFELLDGKRPQYFSYDTADVPVPAQDQNKSPLSLWSSLQPATTPPGDHTPVVPGGAEYFMSQLDFQYQGDNRIAVWALTHTASLATTQPTLTHTVITTLRDGDTYAAPIFGVDQKDGPHPLGDLCGCPEEQLNANDDRMNEAMFTNGMLWAGVNTALPPAVEGGSGKDGDKRAGIMYFQVRPSIDASGNVVAKMARDGYVQVPKNNVIFPSIAASPKGPVAMFFTLTGMDYYPSAAWTRLDGLAPGAAPKVHISGRGAAPEDGFTGYPIWNEFGLKTGLDQTYTGYVARWGDYSFANVDESGCLWGADEYIPGGDRDPQADWGSFVTRVEVPGCVVRPANVPVTAAIKEFNPCGPLFVDAVGDDTFDADGADITATTGQNPQLDLVAGNIRISPDGKTLSTVLVIANLTTKKAPSSEGNIYYFYWTFGNTQYYTEADIDTGFVPFFTDGTVTTAGRSQRKGASDTGSITMGPNGTVIVNVPVSALGKPIAGSILKLPNAETRALNGAGGAGLVFQYDAAGPQYDYQVGLPCRP